jgi:hypothetical protein
MSEIIVNNEIKIIKLNTALKELVQNKLTLTTYEIKHALILNLGDNSMVSPYDVEIIIRLFKKGGICFFNKFIYNPIKQNIELIALTGNVVQLMNKNDMYELHSKEKKLFISFVNDMIKVFPNIKQKYPNFYEALAHYNFSYDEYDWDKIIKYSIFFEAILLKEDEREGINYKLCNRFACLVGNNDFNFKKNAFIFMKKLYDVRSKLVHGVPRIKIKIKLDEKDYSIMQFIKLAEDNLRLSITKYYNLINNFENPTEIVSYLDDLLLGMKTK